MNWIVFTVGFFFGGLADMICSVIADKIVKKYRKKKAAGSSDKKEEDIVE